MPIIPLINGALYGWASITVVIFGVPLAGIVSVDYDEEQKKENLFGRGKYAIGRGYGNVDTKDGSMEIYMDELEQIRNAIPSRKMVDVPMFDVTIVFEGPDGKYTKHILRKCEFKNDPFSGKQGDTKLMAKMILIIGSIEK